MNLPKKLQIPLLLGSFLVVFFLSFILLVASGALLLPTKYQFWKAAQASSLAPLSQETQQPRDRTGMQVRLPVRGILQNPQLPNGCEATSLAIVLQYLGYPAGKMDMAYAYIPREDFWANELGVRSGADPHVAYPGNPGAADAGYYCYPPPVVEGANAFLADQNAAHKALDITGASEEEILTLLDAGLPLIVWKTTDGQPPQTRADAAWLLPDGQAYEPITNLHVVVLTGYNDSYFFFCDPLEGAARMGREELMQNYALTGAYAVAFASTQTPSASATQSNGR